MLFLGDGDSGSGEASGDDVSGSGDDSETVHINDLWHFDPNTTHAPPSLPGSAAAKESSMLSSVRTFVICLVIACVIGVVTKPSVQWQFLLLHLLHVFFHLMYVLRYVTFRLIVKHAISLLGCIDDAVGTVGWQEGLPALKECSHHSGCTGCKCTQKNLPLKHHHHVLMYLFNRKWTWLAATKRVSWAPNSPTMH